MRVDLPRASLNRVLHEFPKLRHHRLDKIDADAHRVEVLLELGVGKLVSVLKFAVISGSLLHRVVCKVYQPRLHIFNVVLTAARPQVSLSVEITLQVTIDCGHKTKAANVELALFVEQGPLAVLLDDVAALFAIDNRVLQNLLDLVKLTADSDTTAPVRVFARLYDPEVFAHGGVAGDLRVRHWMLVRFFKLLEGWVCQPILNMVS